MRDIDSFSSYHPVINFIYFIVVIGLTMVYMHPIFLGISFSVAFIYSIYLKRKTAVKFNFIFAVPMLVVVAFFNPIVSHVGVTPLFYVNNNPITLESIVFGWTSAMMIVSIILWFSCYNVVMTSDKFIYIFGRIIPTLSLIFSMILRFVPRYANEIKKIATAQKCIGKGVGQRGFVDRIRNTARILAITIAWALEDSIITSDSMKSRGYGLKGRTSYSIYRFYHRDKIILVVLIFLALIAIVCSAISVRFQYFPQIIINQPTSMAVCSYIAFLLFCTFPLIIDVLEGIKWKSLA